MAQDNPVGTSPEFTPFTISGYAETRRCKSPKVVSRTDGRVTIFAISCKKEAGFYLDRNCGDAPFRVMADYASDRIPSHPRSVTEAHRTSESKESYLVSNPCRRVRLRHLFLEEITLGFNEAAKDSGLIEEIQLLLRNAGYQVNEIDGRWSVNIAAAIALFCVVHELKTRKLTPTLAKELLQYED